MMTVVILITLMDDISFFSAKDLLLNRNFNLCWLTTTALSNDTDQPFLSHEK